MRRKISHAGACAFVSLFLLSGAYGDVIVHGTVSAIDVSRRTVTVLTPAGPTKFVVTAGAKILYDGQDVTIAVVAADLKAGAPLSVRLVLAKQPDTTAPQRATSAAFHLRAGPG